MVARIWANPLRAVVSAFSLNMSKTTRASSCSITSSARLNRVGLGARLHHYPKRLSGGEQQRVAIARAFVNHRKIIFADEMTGNLDIQTGRMITDILFSLNQEYHTTLVLVTHDEHLAERCEKRYTLSEGMLHAC